MVSSETGINLREPVSVDDVLDALDQIEDSLHEVRQWALIIKEGSDSGT